MTQTKLKAPYPYMGGKASVAEIIWEALGDVAVYIEPFAGSAAVLLARPTLPKVETINDAFGQIVNVWRAIQADPETTAQHADIPVHELTLHAIHGWLMERDTALAERLRADPDYYDPQFAAGAGTNNLWCLNRYGVLMARIGPGLRDDMCPISAQATFEGGRVRTYQDAKESAALLGLRAFQRQKIMHAADNIDCATSPCLREIRMRLLQICHLAQGETS